MFPFNNDIPNNWNINKNMINMSMIYATFARDFLIETMINRMLFILRSIFVKRNTRNMRNTRKKLNCDDSFLFAPMESALLSGGLIISTIANAMISRSKYVNASLKYTIGPSPMNLIINSAMKIELNT